MLPAGIVRLPVTGCHAAPSKYSSALAVSVPTVAVPEVSDNVKSVLLRLGFDKLTVNTARSPSVTIGLEITKVGGPSLSTMVAVPVAFKLLVTPAVVVVVRLNT